MSVEGDIARVSPELLEEVRAVPADAYDRIVYGVPTDQRVDLERAYSGLAILMDAAGFAVNPITSGMPYPDDIKCWGTVEESRSLTVAEVSEAADILRSRPYSELRRHRYVLAEREQFSRPYNEDGLDGYLNRLGQFYPRLVDFFDAAAREGQCTIFWSA